MFELPERFKARYCPIVDDPDAFLSSLATLLPKSFRVNTLKSSPDEVKKRFAGYGISIKQMPWYEDAFVSELPDIGATLEHFTGAIYFQELVSMLPPLLVREELETARWVLDGCAAPGSKTTQMAALMKNNNALVANDIDYGRIRALKFNLERTGAMNTIITNRDLHHFPNSGRQYEVILLDAPCSAEGTMRKNAELFSAWSEKDIENRARLQNQLITKAYDLLVPGGVMVYSTCTFAPEENECVVAQLLKERADAELVSLPDLTGFKLSQPLGEWAGQQFDERISATRRVWPHHNDTGGFFLAKVRKT